MLKDLKKIKFIVTPIATNEIIDVIVSQNRQLVKRCTAYGDMMHLLRKYDVAPDGRNDAMFASKCGEATHH